MDAWGARQAAWGRGPAPYDTGRPLSGGWQTAYRPTNGSPTNGEHTNGEHTNGQHTNGQHTNGQHTNGSHINGSHTNGTHLKDAAEHQHKIARRVFSFGALLGIIGICAVIAWHVYVKVSFMRGNILMPLYTILVSSYVLSRFLLAAFYRPPRDAGIEPSVAIVVPSFNEGEAVARTIHSCMALEYAADRLEIVVVNDGSSDDTWSHMTKAAAEYPRGRVRCIDLGSNQGKRAAMAAGIRATTAEILVFVDSDSMPAPGAIRKLVQGFVDPKVGAISGLTYVRNAETNTLTRMQAARYYVSFQLLKSAESVLGAVTCCSGCFAAYRRSAIGPLLEKWENQRFLGVACTYGDDRALTNRVIKAGWVTRYDCRAEAWTDAPDAYKKFFKQQLRWKKSWSREGPLLLSHIWRSRLRALPSIAVQTIAGLLSPVVIFYNLSKPLIGGKFPMIYVLGLYMVAMAYSLLYRMLRRDGMWLYAFMGTFFYITFSPQLLWALARIRDGKWGTRDSGGPADAEPTAGHDPRHDPRVDPGHDPGHGPGRDPRHRPLTERHESERDTVPLRVYVPYRQPQPRMAEDG